MSEEKALVPAQQMSWQDTMALGRVLAVSKRFSDSANAEQAVVKVLAGRELGFGPIASMVGIYIIKGQVSVSANMMAQAVKRSIKYDYQIVEMTAERCEIAFFERGKDVGHSVFDKADAQKAGTQNMKKFPRNMLFARTMSNGVKWYCPDVFQTGVYTPEELGALVDGEGEIINVTPRGTKSSVTAPQAAEELFDDKVVINGKAAPPSKPEALDSSEWGDIPAPAEWIELWRNKMWALIGFAHENHAKNALKQYEPQNAAEAWTLLLEHQESKVDDAKTAQEPPQEELEF